MTILNEYVSAVTDRADFYKEAEAYYEGNVSELFNYKNAKLRRALSTTGFRGTHNYCRVVVDAVLNRLAIANVVADSKVAQNKITEVWENNQLNLEANEIHRRALEFGDCYALVWPDEDGEWRIDYSTPRSTAIVYDPERPWEKLYAVKIWSDKVPHGLDNKPATKMNVYTRDAIYKYSAKADAVTEGTNWTQIGEEENPFGEVPVFHFRTHRPYGKPEHYEAFGAQNDINKLLATHMFTVDYQGAPQRYALSQAGDHDVVDFGDDDTERENLNALQSEPGSLWYLKGIHGVGQFSPADPKVFWEPIMRLKESMAALTDTPYHYLERGFAGVSGGEALRVAEAPLLKKVADRQTSFGVTWREIFKFILKVEGYSPRLEVKWDLVESMDALGQWDVMLKKRNAGLSMRQVLREQGYEENDIERIMQERLDEMALDGNTSYGRSAPAVRVSTEDNELNGDRNGLTEAAKVNGGRGEDE